ncbi:MAG: glycerophosphodiester phosphodiesterase [Actinomycetales bacterium]
MKPLIYAHRGASARYAEHTRAAYLQALADGADGVECDVQLSADRTPVLLHDSTLDRTSNGTGPVAEQTLARLRDLDFSSWKGADFPDEYGGLSQQFLTLAELLDLLAGAGRGVGLAIELKHPSPFGRELEEKTLQVLAARGWDPRSGRLGNVAITFMSFHPESLEYLARQVPAGLLCQLVDDVDPGQVGRELGLDGPAAIAAVAVAALVERVLDRGERILDDGAVGLAGPGVGYLRARPDRVAAWLSAGLRLRVWTVDDPADVALCAGLGIQEITSNDPAAVRRTLDAL